MEWAKPEYFLIKYDCHFYCNVFSVQTKRTLFQILYGYTDILLKLLFDWVILSENC